ncbi:MAG: DUF3479 domain-containing protein, partial [Pseudomonadota bacterium]
MRVEGPDTPAGGGRAKPPRLRVAIVTLDAHFAAALGRVRRKLAQEAPGLEVSLHAAAEWAESPEALGAAKAAVADADIVLCA